MRVEEGSRIVSLARAPHEDEEPEASAEPEEAVENAPETPVASVPTEPENQV